MNYVRVILALVFLTSLSACNRHRAASLEAVSEQMAEQFRTQHATKMLHHPRKFTSARITGFVASPSTPLLGIDVTWDDITTSTTLPIVQLGDGLFGITYRESAS